MTDINELLPHRPPFQFVDDILSAKKDEIIGIKTYDDPFFLQGHFPEQQLVPSLILIESMAQCGGAGINRLGLANDALWGLATVENAQFFDYIEPNKTVRMVIKTLKMSSKALKQSGTAFCDGKIIVTATWMCVKLA